MPLEGKPKVGVEPTPSPISSKTSSSQTSPDEEKGLKSDKSKPESPGTEDQSSPDDPPKGKPQAGGARKKREPPSDVRMSVLTIDDVWSYDLSSDEEYSYPDDGDDDIENDEEWILDYPEESDPYWTSIRDACKSIVHNARIAIANYDYQEKKLVKFDEGRLTRITSHLNLLNQDLEEFVEATTPESMSSGYKINNLLSLIRCLSWTGPKKITDEDVQGKVDVKSLWSRYGDFNKTWMEKVGELKLCKGKASECWQLFDKNRPAIARYNTEADNFVRREGEWTTDPMPESDLSRWNAELRSLGQIIQGLCSDAEEIETGLLGQFEGYVRGNLELKNKLSSFLCMEDSATFTDEI